MDPLAELLDPAAVAGLLALASATVGGAPIALLDAEGRHVAGGEVAGVPAALSPVAPWGEHLGSIVGGPGATAEVAALTARSLELALVGAREHADRARVAHELSIGRRIQLALLPRRFPEAPGWSFGADYEPAREVGGDLYDAFPLRGRTDRIGLLVADVTGKGLPAALLMADVRALLHAAADNADGPADALLRVNRILAGERPTSLFVTAALCIVDTASGEVRHASAGHEAPIVVRADGGIDRLEAAGPILGAFAGVAFEEHVGRLGPGDALVLYTDGVTETRDQARAFYGEERLLARLAAAHGRHASAIVEDVLADVRAFRGPAEAFDDLTFLVARRD